MLQLKMVQEVVNHTSFELPKSTLFGKIEKKCIGHLAKRHKFGVMLGRDVRCIPLSDNAGIFIRDEVNKKAILIEFHGKNTENMIEQVCVTEMEDVEVLTINR